VNDNGVAAIESEQLMFAATLDAVDSLASGASSTGRREPFPERRMNRSHASNRFPKRGFR
jgi:hypothetical protein